MPTKENQLNPQGLMERARALVGEFDTAHAQLDGFLMRVADDRRLADALDDATRNEDRSEIAEIFRRSGVEGEIKIEKIELDTALYVEACVFPGVCFSVTFKW